jgi:sugar O-acyltransferase (sialic acid O-acetyltransferase NeuD family)
MTHLSRKKLYIIGAGGFGREVLWTASEVPASRRDWEIAGFLDDDVDRARASLASKGVDLPVVDAVQDHRPVDGEVFVCSIRNPVRRLEACRSLRDRGAEFASVLHPTALLHPTAKVGVGLVMRHYSGLSPNSVTGDFVILNSSCGAAHDSTLGDGCILGAHSDVMGGAQLGQGVELGSHAVVLPNARVGDFALVGVGSVVLRRVAAHTTVFGVPAKRLEFTSGPVRNRTEIAR